MAVDPGNKSDVLEPDSTEFRASFGQLKSTIDVPGQVGILRESADRLPFIVLRNKSGQGRKQRRDRMPERTGPAVAVTGGTGTGIGKASGRDDQSRARKRIPVRAKEGKTRSIRLNIRNFLARQHLYAGIPAGIRQQIDHVRRPIGQRKRAVSSLDHGFQPLFVEEVDQLPWREIEKSRTREIGLRTDVL